MATDRLDRLPAVGAFGDDPHRRRLLEPRNDPAPPERLVVHDDGAQCHCFRALAGTYGECPARFRQGVGSRPRGRRARRDRARAPRPRRTAPRAAAGRSRGRRPAGPRDPRSPSPGRRRARRASGSRRPAPAAIATEPPPSRGKMPWRTAFSTRGCRMSGGTSAASASGATAISTFSRSPKRASSISRYLQAKSISSASGISRVSVRSSVARRKSDSRESMRFASADRPSETSVETPFSALKRKCGFSCRRSALRRASCARSSIAEAPLPLGGEIEVCLDAEVEDAPGEENEEEIDRVDEIGEVRPLPWALRAARPRRPPRRGCAPPSSPRPRRRRAVSPPRRRRPPARRTPRSARYDEPQDEARGEPEERQARLEDGRLEEAATATARPRTCRRRRAPSRRAGGSRRAGAASGSRWDSPRGLRFLRLPRSFRAFSRGCARRREA